jgi:hypothetical protein
VINTTTSHQPIKLVHTCDNEPAAYLWLSLLAKALEQDLDSIVEWHLHAQPEDRRGEHQRTRADEVRGEVPRRRVDAKVSAVDVVATCE